MPRDSEFESRQGHRWKEYYSTTPEVHEADQTNRADRIYRICIRRRGSLGSSSNCIIIDQPTSWLCIHFTMRHHENIVGRRISNS